MASPGALNRLVMGQSPARHWSAALLLTYYFLYILPPLFISFSVVSCTFLVCLQNYHNYDRDLKYIPGWAEFCVRVVMDSPREAIHPCVHA